MLWKAAKELGHESLIASEYDGNYDLLINISGEPFVPAVEGKPSFYWHTDSFFQGLPEQKFWTHLFIGGCPEDLDKFPKHTVYIPHACDLNIHKAYPCEKIYDVVFIGSHSPIYEKRINTVNRLKLRYNVHDSETGFGKEYSKELSMGKLIFNMSLGEKNIPMRFFEGMAIGALLQNYNENLNSLAIPHKHYIPYLSEDDLIKQIDYYLSHEDQRATLARQARRHVSRHHTYKHRLKTMLSYL